MTDTTTALKVEDLIAEVRRLAAENPNFNYKEACGPEWDGTCTYAPTDQTPACIIGQALTNLGITRQNVYEGHGVNRFLGDIVGDYDRQTGHWLAWVQGEQDRGLPWAEAVAAADVEYPGV